MNDAMLRENLKNNLLTLRKTNNMTQQQLADLLGIERSTYTSWEAGRSLPKPAQFVKLSEIYNVSFEFLTESIYQHKLVVNSPLKNPYRVYGDSFVSELNDYERTIILKLRMMNSNDKKSVEEFIESITKNNE